VDGDCVCQRLRPGQLRPLMPDNTHAANDRSQGAADLTRHGTRGEQISEADPQRFEI
jgi:hypothetical protein